MLIGVPGKQLLGTLKSWRNYSGRSTRREYWTWAAFYFGAALVIPSLGALTSTYSGALGVLVGFSWYLLVPAQIAVAVRRMHDVGKPGWYFLIPLYGFYLSLQPSVVRPEPPLDGDV